MPFSFERFEFDLYLLAVFVRDKVLSRRAVLVGFYLVLLGCLLHWSLRRTSRSWGRFRFRLCGRCAQSRRFRLLGRRSGCGSRRSASRSRRARWSVPLRLERPENLSFPRTFNPPFVRHHVFWSSSFPNGYKASGQHVPQTSYSHQNLLFQYIHQSKKLKDQLLLTLLTYYYIEQQLVLKS